MEWDALLSTVRIRDLDDPKSPKPGADPRSEFQRDYDRAVFSSPVRRLQDKAQVFPLEQHDAVRTRLTHSLEVSTVARGLSRGVAQDLLERQIVDAEQANAIETISATCGLVHDLGNPPFGHAGEEAIAQWFKGLSDKQWHGLDEEYRSDFLKFEGNAQTIRLLSKLQILVDAHGMNLTCGTLSAVCKYVASSSEADKDDPDHSRTKPGYFKSESDLIRRLAAHTGTNGARHPITYLVEAADDTVYCTIDLEDGVKKGVVTWEVLRSELLEQGLDVRVIEEAELYVERANPPLEGKDKDEAISQAFRTAVVGRVVPAVAATFRARYASIMKGAYEGELWEDSKAADLVRACKNVGRSCVYSAGEIPLLEVRGREVLHSLLDLFAEGVRDAEGEQPPRGFGRRIYNLMSSNYRRVFEASWDADLPHPYLKFQLLTDYVCGMTDSYASSLHRSLTNG